MRMNARAGWALLLGMLLAVAAAPAWAKPKNQIKYFLVNSGLQPGAKGKLIYVSNKPQTFFTIKISDAVPGTYDVALNGAIVDTITVGSDGDGKVSHRFHKNGKHGAALAYDPRGGFLSIQATGTEVLFANIPSSAAEAQAKTEVEVELPNMGVGAGQAEAELESRFGRSEFEVELEGAAPGIYDVLVGGVKRGEIVVGATGSGEIEFDSRPSTDDDDDGLDQLLTFDPRGQEIQIAQGGVAMFAATFPLL